MRAACLMPDATFIDACRFLQAFMLVFVFADAASIILLRHFRRRLFSLFHYAMILFSPLRRRHSRCHCCRRFADACRRRRRRRCRHYAATYALMIFSPSRRRHFLMMPLLIDYFSPYAIIFAVLFHFQRCRHLPLFSYWHYFAIAPFSLAACRH
jgi:hypothetical protein